MNTLFGDAAQLASKLRQSIMAAGFLANVAVAQNFHACRVSCIWQNRRLRCAAWR